MLPNSYSVDLLAFQQPPVANHNHLVHDQQQDLREINSHAIRIARAGLKPLAVSQNKKYMKIQQAELKVLYGYVLLIYRLRAMLDLIHFYMFIY